MPFSWDFVLNMLENDYSDLQIKFGVHITSNIFKIIQFQNHGIVPTPHLPTLKAYPTPGEGGMFNFFFAKMRGNDELKDTWSSLSLGYALLSTGGKLFGGLLQSPSEN